MNTKTKSKSKYVFHSEEWCYIQDAKGIVLVCATDQETYTLKGFEATIWSWLNLNYSYRKLVKLLAALLEIPEEDAAKKLQTIFAKWVEMGILAWEIVYHD